VPVAICLVELPEQKPGEMECSENATSQRVISKPMLIPSPTPSNSHTNIPERYGVRKRNISVDDRPKPSSYPPAPLKSHTTTPERRRRRSLKSDKLGKRSIKANNQQERVPYTNTPSATAPSDSSTFIVNVFMSFDSDHKHLKNSDIYLGAFSEMVAAFHHLVNVVKAAEYAALSICESN